MRSTQGDKWADSGMKFQPFSNRTKELSDNNLKHQLRNSLQVKDDLVT